MKDFGFQEYLIGTIVVLFLGYFIYLAATGQGEGWVGSAWLGD